MNKHRILIVGDSPFVDTGFAHITRELGRIFHNAGYPVEHIGMWDPRPNSIIKSFSHYSFPYNIHICKPPFKKYTQTEYLEVINDFQPTIIIIVTDIWHADHFIAPNNIPTLFYFHVEGEPLPEITKSPESGILNWIESLVKNKKVIFAGGFGKKTVLDRIKKNRVYNQCVSEFEKNWPIISNGINLETFKPLSNKQRLKHELWKLKETDIVIGYFGRQNARKCLPYALEAFAKWPNRPDNVYFYAHTPLKDSAGWNFPTLVKDLGLEDKVIVNIKLTEAKGIDEINLNRTYNACDMVICTSLGEGFGQTACVGPESMVKTSKGYIPIENVKVGDLVMTHKCRYQPVIEVFKLPHKGHVYRVYTDTTIPFSITTNENVLCWKSKNKKTDKTFIPISKCNTGDYLKYPIYYDEFEHNLYKIIKVRKSIKSVNYQLILRCRDLLISGRNSLYNIITKVGKNYILNIYKSEFQRKLSITQNDKPQWKRYILNRIQKKELIPYNGYVHTMTIENDHSFVINGGATISNCQALAVGTPVIITDYSELSQFNDGTLKIKPSFFYVETGTNIRRALVKLEDIIECYKQVFDTAKMKQLSEAAILSVNKFSWKNIGQQWIDTVETVPLISKEIHGKEMVSIILPVYNSNINDLRNALQSIKNQTYINYEIIVVDDGSTNQTHLDILKEFNGVTLLVLDKNTGIANATTKGIEKAKGKYIGFLDHDDLLKKTCLEKTVQYLNTHKDEHMVYTDEEIVNNKGHLIQKVYKEDYNEDLLLAMMYVNHFRLYDADKLKEFIPLQYSGAQDYDLTLRFSEKYKIGHLREILYTWRASDTSSLQGIKEDIVANNKSAVESALKRRNIEADVKVNTMPTQWHIDRKLNTQDLVSIIILTKDKLHLIKNCIESIEKNTDYPYELIIVDTGSTDPEVIKYLEEVKKKHTIINDNFHFSRSNNDATKIAKGKYFCFLNNDTVAMKGWLPELMKQAQRPEVGIVGPKLLFQNDTIQHAGVALGIGGLAGHMYLGAPKNALNTMFTMEVSAVTGACIIIKKELFEKVNGFDCRYMIEFQDIDLCMKIKQLGYKIIYTPFSTLYHYCSLTRGNPTQREAANDRSLFAKRWYKQIDIIDPFITFQNIDRNNKKQLDMWFHAYDIVHKGKTPW